MILEELKAKLPEYMRARDSLRLGVLRYLLAQIKNKEIELRYQSIELNDDHIAKILKKEMKNRRESIEFAEKANRQDVVDQESAELSVLKEFTGLLPEHEF